VILEQILSFSFVREGHQPNVAPWCYLWICDTRPGRLRTTSWPPKRRNTWLGEELHWKGEISWYFIFIR
jgi:hypothetical protein